MELSNLRYFYEVAKLEHVSRAAENLHIAQPALTKSIKILEEELGVKLFYKTGRGIKLNDYGIFLKNKIEPIIKELNDLPYTVQNFVEMSKNTININVLAASTITTDVIIKFKKIHPEAVFKMTQKEDYENADISVFTNSSKIDNLMKVNRHAIIVEKIYIAVPIESEYSKLEGINLSDLKKCNFISLSGSRRFRPLCDNYCEYAGFKPNIVFESDSLISVKNLIASGVGFSFWPEFSWGEIKHNNIKLLNILEPDCHREIIVCENNNKQSELCRVFYDFLVKELSHH